MDFKHSLSLNASQARRKTLVRRSILALFAIVVLLTLYNLPFRQPLDLSSHHGSLSSSYHKTSSSKNAFAVYLAETENEDDEDAEDDPYFTSIRMQIYQLLHDPRTRTLQNIPFVVLVSPGVNQSKRLRLHNEGAMVVEFPQINIATVHPGRDRWKRVMDKLNVFKLTQFEKVLLMDSDIVIFARLDGVFDDPAAATLQINRGDPSKAASDEGPQPQIYLMAANCSPKRREKGVWPPEKNGVLNAGFVVIHPSEEMFEHYIRVVSIEGRTPTDAPENNLWEYVHRRDYAGKEGGNMPFTELNGTWIANGPIYEDYTMGIKAVHEKWFRNSMTDMKLRDVLLKARWRMDGYWSRED